MSNNSPGPSNSVQLLPKPRALNLQLCILCQHVKDSKGSTKLTSTADGRRVIFDTTEMLQDGLLANVDENDSSCIHYHVKTCYATYKRRGERHEELQTQKRNSDTPNPSPLMSPERRPKRSKIVASPVLGSPVPKEKPCIICDHVKCIGDIKRYRIGSKDMANKLLKAANFNKDNVFTSVVFLKTPGDVYANDIMYHVNCFNKYVNKFKRDVEALMADDFGNPDLHFHVELAFKNMIDDMDISKKGYALSDVRDTLNKELEIHGKI